MSRFGGKKYKVSEKVKKFRMNCWESIFGDQYALGDPLDELMWEHIEY